MVIGIVIVAWTMLIWKQREVRNSSAQEEPEQPQNLQPIALSSLETASNDVVPSVQSVPVSDGAPTVPENNLSTPLAIDLYAKNQSLNLEQTRAFTIVANHSLVRHEQPLRMFLSGAGGTGKSRVINTLVDFFRIRNESRRLRLCSFTGVAAQNIGGMTLHTALSLHQRTTSRTGTTSGTYNQQSELSQMWEKVDYLFIDEVSMIGCDLMLTIHDALVDAKGNTAPFGGINIIFAGDFAQLPPVCASRLFSRMKPKSSLLLSFCSSKCGKPVRKTLVLLSCYPDFAKAVKASTRTVGTRRSL